MGRYEELAKKFDYIPIFETDKLPAFQRGCYINGEIYINEDISEYEKHAVLHEELSHHFLSYGDITNQDKFINRKFESYAKRLSYRKALSLGDIVDAFKIGLNNLYEMSQHFELSESHIQDILNYYRSKHGLSVMVDDYLIQFEPLRVYEYKKIE